MVEPKNDDDDVNHPRYGRAPRFTGATWTGDRAHWRYGRECVIPGTGIPADVSRHSRALFPLAIYLDVDSICRGCGRRFLFFAVAGT